MMFNRDTGRILGAAVEVCEDSANVYRDGKCFEEYISFEHAKRALKAAMVSHFYVEYMER